MSIDSVLSKFVFKSDSGDQGHAWREGSLSILDWQRELVTNWIISLYRSPTAAAKLESITQGDQVVLISGIIFPAGGGGGAYADGRQISIDFTQIVKIIWFNKIGEVAQSRGDIAFAHELIHLNDPPNFPSGQVDPAFVSGPGDLFTEFRGQYT